MKKLLDILAAFVTGGLTIASTSLVEMTEAARHGSLSSN